MRKMAWTLWVPAQNTKNCILTRPPLVVFALCVASFGIATLGLALYVKNTSSPLSDPDELSWNDIASKFNKLKFCTQVGDMVLNRTDMVALSVPFDMTVPYSDVWNNYSLISGSVSASDLGFYDHPGTNLSFSFSHMKSHNKICLNVYHPPSIYLPEVIDSCNPLQYNQFPKSIGAFVLPREERPSAPILNCGDGAIFDLRLLSNPGWTVLLKEDDRSLVSLHLLATSAFLLTTFMVMLCFAAVRGGHNHRNKTIKINASIGRDATQSVGEDKEPLNP